MTVPVGNDVRQVANPVPCGSRVAFRVTGCVSAEQEAALAS